MTDPPPAQDDASSGWRSDPGWRLVWYAVGIWPATEAPNQPTENAELAQPPIWASLYDGTRAVATWWRPVVRVAEPSNEG